MNKNLGFQDGEPASRKQRSPSHGADTRATCRTEDELLLFLEMQAAAIRVTQMETQTWPRHP